jgi:hypothetical protein
VWCRLLTLVVINKADVWWLIRKFLMRDVSVTEFFPSMALGTSCTSSQWIAVATFMIKKETMLWPSSVWNNVDISKFVIGQRHRTFLLEELLVAHLGEKFLAVYGTKSVITCSEEPAASLEPHESSPYLSAVFKVHFNIVFTSSRRSSERSLSLREILALWIHLRICVYTNLLGTT